MSILCGICLKELPKVANYWLKTTVYSKGLIVKIHPCLVLQKV